MEFASKLQLLVVCCTPLPVKPPGRNRVHYLDLIELFQAMDQKV